MKFTHRLVFLTIVIAGALFFSTSINVLVLWQTHQAQGDTGPFRQGGVHREFFREDAAIKQNVEEEEGEEWKSVEEMKETLDFLKGHLAVMRKDLDYSNASARAASRRLGSSQLLYERLMSDPNFHRAKHRDKLMKLVRALGDPDPGSKNLGPPDERIWSLGHKKQVRGFAQTKRPPPERLKEDNHRVEPNVTASMADRLQDLVDSTLSKRKRKKKKGISMRIHRYGATG